MMITVKQSVLLSWLVKIDNNQVKMWLNNEYSASHITQKHPNQEVIIWISWFISVILICGFYIIKKQNL